MSPRADHHRDEDPVNEQRRQAAIEAGERALAHWYGHPGVCAACRRDAAAVIDAAAPHLAGEPVGYAALRPEVSGLDPDWEPEGAPMTVFPTAEDAARWGVPAAVTLVDVP